MAVEMGGRINTRSKDKNNNRRPPRRTLRSKSDSKDSYLQEIEKLEEEIRHLESEIDQQEASAGDDLDRGGTIEKVILDLKEADQTPNTTSTGTNTLHSQDETLLSRISSLETYTGIRFEQNQCTVILKSASKATWKRNLEGSCQKIRFVVEFEVDESEVEEGTSEGEQESTAVITRLSIDVKDSLASQELNSYIKGVEKNKALQPFLQTLVQYGECHHNRQRTFSHFKTKFPDVVHLLWGSACSTAMQMINPVKPGLIFTVQWRLEVTPAGRVTPNIEIHASAPLAGGKEARNPLLRTAPQQFRKMLSTLGIEHSIEMILSIVLRL